MAISTVSPLHRVGVCALQLPTMLAHEIHGDGPTLVLLHGFPLDRRIWNDVTPSLSQAMRVITIDLQGFGQSKSSEPFTLAEQAQMVYETLLELQALPVVLGGLSMGGYVSNFRRRCWDCC